MKKEGGESSQGRSESSQGRSESSQGAVSLHIDMSVTLHKPEDWTEDWEASTFEVPSWEYIAERQLENKYLAGDLNELVEGDMLAMQDRNCITEQWPRRVFVLISLECAYTFDENGALIDEPGNFVVKGRQPLNADGHGFIEEWNDEQYYRIPPLAAVPSAAKKAADAAAHGAALSALYSEELEASSVDRRFPVMLQSDSSDAAATALPAPVPAPAAFQLPVQGSVIQIYNGSRGWEKCFVFKAAPNSGKMAVVYADRMWEAMSGSLGVKWSSAEDTAEEAPSGAIISFKGKVMVPQGFLYGRQEDASGWEWYTRYEAGGAGHKDSYFPSRLPRLAAGQHVVCKGRVLGGGDAGEGCDGAVLVAIAQCREKEAKARADVDEQGAKPPQWRRFAVVAIEDQLRIAELMSNDEGYIAAVEPARCLSDEQLKVLLDKVRLPSSRRRMSAHCRRNSPAFHHLQLRSSCDRAGYVLLPLLLLPLPLLPLLLLPLPLPPPLRSSRHQRRSYLTI